MSFDESPPVIIECGFTVHDFHHLCEIARSQGLTPTEFVGSAIRKAIFNEISPARSAGGEPLSQNKH